MVGGVNTGDQCDVLRPIRTCGVAEDHGVTDLGRTREGPIVCAIVIEARCCSGQAGDIHPGLTPHPFGKFRTPFPG